MSGPLMSAMGLGRGDEEAPFGEGPGPRQSAAAPPRGRASLEEVYRKYRAYERQQQAEGQGAGGRPGEMLVAPMLTPGIPTTRLSAGDELSAMLEPLGYGSIAELEAFIADVERSFEREAARGARELLDRYAQGLHREVARYRDPAELSSLHGQLGGVRTQHELFEKNASFAQGYVANAERARLPGNGQLRSKASPQEAVAAHQRSVAARAAAQRELGRLAATHPIFQEEGLPLDRRLDKVALAEADEAALGALLQAHLSTRLGDVAEARALLEAQPELIYKLDALLPRLLAQQSIAPGSVFALILEDKRRDEAIARLAAGILVAVVAIALGAVSLGAATPAVAAGAAAVGFGLSAGTAYQELREHDEQQELAEVGFTEDPSVAWLAVAVLGAALDLGAATRALKALGPAVQAASHGGDPVELVRVIRAYEKAGQIDARIARAVEKGAAARQGFFEAVEELRVALLGKAFAFPGPLADPDVFRHLVRLAKEGMNVAFHELSQFVEYLRRTYQLSQISSEEMVQVRKAWDQAVTLGASAKTPIEIREGGELIGRFSSGSQLEIIPRNEREKLYAGTTIKLSPEKTTTITGTLTDTNIVAERGFFAPGTTLVGENVGGINVLRSPQWKAIQEKHHPLLAANPSLYWKTVSDEFWETVNKPWLDDAVRRGDAFRFVSDPNLDAALYVTKNKKFVLYNGERIRSIFGREVDYLKSHGYAFRTDGTAVKELR